jgi:D-alanyl-D-alanine carboxypeptidase/D-alanyl-D-alanine-endopeptidase (penicillin-binding protein 4)
MELLKREETIAYVADRAFAQFSPRGRGWTFDDYQQEYAPERSEMPIYGNVARFTILADSLDVTPRFFYNSGTNYTNSVLRNGAKPWFNISRPFENNSFFAPTSNERYRTKSLFQFQAIPFKTTIYPENLFRNLVFVQLLQDTLKKVISDAHYIHYVPRFKSVIHSQPTDSLLKPMMHRSDNFFAEQSLLMVSNERLGFMNDEKIIDTLLKTDFKDLPQKPRWVDGSGLSRYNLFTPQDFVFILNKMKTEFGMFRIKNIFATGGEGTLSSYYKKDSSFIYAKTGTLSGVVALSGFLYTKAGKELIFSVLVNNHQGSATNVRRAVEKFIQGVREKY